MYVDSGADLTLVPQGFGKLLGMDLKKNIGLVAGVTGAPLKVSLQSSEIRIGHLTATARVAVALTNEVPYLLGREGLFRLFKVIFQEYKGLVQFEPQRR